MFGMLVCSHALSVMMYRRAPNSWMGTWRYTLTDNTIILSAGGAFISGLVAAVSSGKSEVSLRKTSLGVFGLSLLSLAGGATMCPVTPHRRKTCRVDGSVLKNASDLLTETSPESDKVSTNLRLKVVQEILMDYAVVFHESHIRQSAMPDASSPPQEAESPLSILLEPKEYLFQVTFADGGYSIEDMTQFQTTVISPRSAYIFYSKEGEWLLLSSNQNSEVRLCCLKSGDKD